MNEPRSDRTGNFAGFAILLGFIVPFSLAALLSDWRFYTTYEIQWLNMADWMVTGSLIGGGLAFAWYLVHTTIRGLWKDRPHVIVAVLLAAFYGLRRASICDLLVRDVDFEAGTIGWATKTGQRLVRPLHPRVREALARLAHGRRAGDSLLGYTDYHSLTTAFRRLVQRVGLGRRFRFHGLRHDFGTRILRKTGNLRVAQEALGHSRITQTEPETNA